MTHGKGSERIKRIRRFVHDYAIRKSGRDNRKKKKGNERLRVDRNHFGKNHCEISVENIIVLGRRSRSTRNKQPRYSLTKPKVKKGTSK